MPQGGRRYREGALFQEVGIALEYLLHPLEGHPRHDTVPIHHAAETHGEALELIGPAQLVQLGPQFTGVIVSLRCRDTAVPYTAPETSRRWRWVSTGPVSGAGCWVPCWARPPAPRSARCRYRTSAGGC